MSKIWDKLLNKSQAAQGPSTEDQLSAAAAGSQSESLGNTIFPGILQSTYTLPPGVTAASGMAITSSSLFGINPLTPEENKELLRLREELKLETQKLKLEQFKKINPELRQFVVNMMYWEDHVKDMNTIEVPKSERMKELEQKDQAGKMFFGGPISSIDFSMFGSLRIPENISKEELKQAHLDACLEEEMIDGNKES